MAVPAQPHAVRPAAPATAAARTTDLPLLLVDDSAVVRAKLRKLFEGAGYPVLLARDGLEALAVLDQHRCALMVTDLEMPKVDGLQLISTLASRADVHDMPILAITGHDSHPPELLTLRGVRGIFRKPWNDVEFLQRVKTLLPQASVAHSA